MRPSRVALVLGVIGCSPAARPAVGGGERPVPAPALAAGDSTRILAELAVGKQVVQTTCAACHAAAMPPKTAPPLAMVAMHYRERLGSDDTVRARIAAWVPAPSAERSLLPPMAIQRFGLMPAQPLPDSLVRAAARYVLTLDGGGMHRGGMMRGGGMMHEGGMMQGGGMRHGGAMPGAGRPPAPPR